ncbi:MAG: hypothetical protein HY814_03405 [Candidatus Riflebacteria bacterium]|nr:hypothetical protein [Candidatus Riflebacteria bacterium]
MKPPNDALHDAAPPASSRFDPVPDAYGVRLALVFGNHAPDGLCPYASASLCHHCDVGLGEGRAFSTAMNLRRLAWFRDSYAAVLPGVTHLALYNSGSVLDPRQMPRRLLFHLLEWAGSLPALRVLSVDTREEHLTHAVLGRVSERLGTAVTLRPILGVESADDTIRQTLLEKRMDRWEIERSFRETGQARAAGARVGLDVNVVVGAPGTTAETLIGDAAATARTCFELGVHHGVDVDLNLHAYYPTRRGLARFPGHPRCAPEAFLGAVRQIGAVRAALSPSSKLFIGWEDEGHDLQPELRARELERLRAAFEAFNRLQDPGVLLEADVPPEAVYHQETGAVPSG